MQKGKKVNGNMNVDTPQMEEMRRIVVEQELSARSHKAYYEKMYYAMEAEKIEPAYMEFVKRRNERLEKEREAFEQFQQALAGEIEKVNEANPNGDIALEEAN